MIKRGYTEYQMPLEHGVILRVTIEHGIEKVTFAEVYANGDVSDDVITVPCELFAPLVEIVKDIEQVIS